MYKNQCLAVPSHFRPQRNPPPKRLLPRAVDGLHLGHQSAGWEDHLGTREGVLEQWEGWGEVLVNVFFFFSWCVFSSCFWCYVMFCCFFRGFLGANIFLVTSYRLRKQHTGVLLIVLGAVCTIFSFFVYLSLCSVLTQWHWHFYGRKTPSRPTGQHNKQVFELHQTKCFLKGKQEHPRTIIISLWSYLTGEKNRFSPYPQQNENI